MPRIFWIIGLVLLMATANIEGTPCSTIDAVPPASPTYASWVAGNHLTLQASIPNSCVDNNVIIHAIGRCHSGHHKYYTPKAVRAQHFNLSSKRSFWSLIHAPIYPSEVNIC